MDTVGRTLSRRGSSDGGFCLLVAAGVVAYLLLWPNNLYDADESYFLLDARRISQGDALYRDIFWLSTPLAHWLMAGVFTLFGASIEVARLAMAVLHGATAALLATTCRRLTIRWSLAVLPSVAYISLCHAAFPCASPHWIATAVIAGILFVAVTPYPGHPIRRPLVLGLLVAALGAIYQQQGAAFFVVLLLLFPAEHLAAKRTGIPLAPGTLKRALGYFLGASAIVTLPILGWMLATAGPYELFDQLVLLPLTGYRATNQSWWGKVGFMALSFARYTYPLLFKYLPLLLVLGAFRMGRTWSKAGDVRVLLALCSVCAASALSVMHNPDFIHIAFIAPPFFVLAAETAERGLRWIDRWMVLSRVLAWSLSAALLVVLAVKASDNLERIRSSVAISYQSAFGRIDLPSEKYVDIIDQTRKFLKQSDSKEMFIFPLFTSLYLTAGADNATRFSALSSVFNSPRQMEEARTAVREKRPPLVVMCEIFLDRDEPLPRYVLENYEVLYQPNLREFPCTLFGRRDADWDRSEP